MLNIQKTMVDDPPYMSTPNQPQPYTSLSIHFYYPLFSHQNTIVRAQIRKINALARFLSRNHFQNNKN